MLDNIKFRTDKQEIINRVLLLPDFVMRKNSNKRYYSRSHKDIGAKLSFDFVKLRETQTNNEYSSLFINISPHYHYNNYKHNGNDFTPENCIKSISEVLNYLQIEPHNYNELNVCNLEFGLNIIPDTNIEELINGLLFHKKTKFIIPNTEIPFFKITNSTKYKEIKAYAKGLQFPEYCDKNTFRFEVKTKQSKNVRTYGINTVSDLLNTETYNRLAQELLNEWEHILITNNNPDFSELKKTEIQFIKQGNNGNFWEEIINSTNRNKFTRYKGKYYSILKGKNDLHTQIKSKIIDKLFSFQSGANSTHRTPINKGKEQNQKLLSTLINLEYAPLLQKCKVTGLSLEHEKEGANYIRTSTLKYLKKNDKETFNLLRLYLLKKSFDRPKFEQDEIKHLAKQIRNNFYNPIKTRQAGYKKPIPKNQYCLFAN